MSPNLKGGRHNEERSTDTWQQLDAFQGAPDQNGKGSSKRRAPKKTLTGTVSVEWDPAYLCVRLNSKLLASVLGKVGVAGWNDLMMRLVTTHLIDGFSPIAPTPVSIHFGFNLAKLPCQNLDGIDLRWCELDGADLSRCSLRKAMFGDARHVNFERADLRGALFDGVDLTGARFARAKTGGMRLEACVGYDAETPPTGLPARLLAQCTAWATDHWKRRLVNENRPAKKGRDVL